MMSVTSPRKCRKDTTPCKCGKTDLWNQHSFADCVETLKKTAKFNCRLVIRTERSISKDTGTLLSPTDRELGITLKTNSC